MERLDDSLAVHDRVEVNTSPEGLRLEALEYSLLVEATAPYIHLYDSTGNEWAMLSLTGSIDTLECPDEMIGPPVVDYSHDEDGSVILRVASDSTAWETKEQVWICKPRHIEMHYELHGSGHISTIDYFAGHYADTKDTGYFPSGAQFRSVFNPEPSASEQRTHSAAQSSSINVTGMSRPGRFDWFMTPAPFCYGLSRAEAPDKGTIPPGEWLMMGVVAPVESQHFTQMQYSGLEQSFSVKLDYENQTKINGLFRSPSIMLHYADDPYIGLADHALHVARHTVNESIVLPKAKFDWWKDPIFCGWGEQVERAERADVLAPDLARQDVYDEMMDTLSVHNVHPGIITIDDKWQDKYGLNTVDTEKWPDMPAWIRRRHTLGQKVLLWLKAFDAEGLNPELCVRNAHGAPVSVDPSHPEFAEMLRQQVRYMLSPEGLDADGFKIDFTARTPSGRTLERYGHEWGVSMLHKYLKTIYSEAKSVKPDSLIVTHTPNTSFHDVTDMIRFNDTNCGTSVIEQMAHRAKVAMAVCPDLAVDTDNWPMPSIEEWRAYMKVQPELGGSVLYFASTVAGKPILEKDYEMIRSIWQEQRLRSERNLSVLPLK